MIDMKDVLGEGAAAVGAGIEETTATTVAVTVAQQIGGGTTTTIHGRESGIEASQERGLDLDMEETETAVLIGTGGTALGIVLEKGRRMGAEIGIWSARVRRTEAVVAESPSTKIVRIVNKSNLCLPK